ncbi:MAG: class I SAM-dependent methyltransferase [Methanobacteriaceae archaeon]|jgi:SAM-dependent methyltransferase
MKRQKPYFEDYWDRRATQFGGKSKGYPAICSYGMPDFYNNHINRLQQHLLLENLKVRSGMKVLDAGCGVGRWTVAMALKGAQVTAADISQEMIALARERTRYWGVEDRVEFLHSPLNLLRLSDDYDLVVVVTVLQHIPDLEIWEQSVLKLWGAVKEGGRFAILEVAPTNKSWVKIPSREHFHPHLRDEYVDLLEKSGGALALEKGMDFLNFKYRLLGWDKKGSIKRAVFCLATLLSEPVDRILAPSSWGTIRSWHRLMVFQKRANERKSCMLK